MFAICINNCKIIGENISARDEELELGTVVRILETSENKSNLCYITKWLPSKKLPLVWSKTVFLCQCENLRQISTKLLDFLVGVKELKSRVAIVQNAKFVDFISGIKIHDEVWLLGELINFSNTIKSTVKYIGEVPQIGIGNYIGLKFLNTSIPVVVRQFFIPEYFNGLPHDSILVPINIIFNFDGGNEPGRRFSILDTPVPTETDDLVSIETENYAGVGDGTDPYGSYSNLKQSQINWQKVPPNVAAKVMGIQQNPASLARQTMETITEHLEKICDLKNVDNYPETVEDVAKIKHLEKLLSNLRCNWRDKKLSSVKCFACKTKINGKNVTGAQSLYENTMLQFNCDHFCCVKCLLIKVENNLRANFKCDHENNDRICNGDIKLGEIVTDMTKPQIIQLNCILNKQDVKQNVKTPQSVDGVFVCKTKNCHGKWMTDRNGKYRSHFCPVCSVQNCVSCDAIHLGISCKEFVKIRQEIVPIMPKCVVCDRKYNKNEVYTVQNCDHGICVDCLIDLIRATDDELICPGKIGKQRCLSHLQPQNFPQAIKPAMIKDYDVRRTNKLIATTPNSYQCKTMNCLGWWIVENGQKHYMCPKCNEQNCVICETIHKKVVCHEYQRNILSGKDHAAIAKLKGKLTKREVGEHELFIKKLVKNTTQARNAMEMVDEMPKMNIEDICWAVRCGDTMENVRKLLNSNCELCYEQFPRNKMIAMVHCEHVCCSGCAKKHFTVQVKDKSIKDCVCPFCQLPNHDDPNVDINQYFQLLDPLLREILDADVYDIFQKKLTEGALMADPNFKWCSQCSYGFIVHHNNIEVECPDCKARICIKCNQLWEDQHRGLSCDQFADWKKNNDPDLQAKGVDDYLKGNSIVCPQCKYRYSLSRGGCMHFACTQCKYVFCAGCARQFYEAGKCNLNGCDLQKSLHGHHPRNCFYYMRDVDVPALEALLTKNGKQFTPDATTVVGTTCNRKLQDNLDSPERPCGKEILNTTSGGMCSLHYKEYLGEVIFQEKVDPVDSYDLQNCILEIKRNRLAVPARDLMDTDPVYLTKCVQFIKNNIKLA